MLQIENQFINVFGQSPNTTWPDFHAGQKPCPHENRIVPRIPIESSEKNLCLAQGPVSHIHEGLEKIE